MRLFTRMIRCNGCKNLILVFVLLALLNLFLMVYSLFSVNTDPVATERRRFSFPDSDKWLVKEPLLGKGVGTILDELSHGPETPVLLFRPVCRTGTCAKYSGVELRKVFKQNGFDIVNKSDKEWTVSFTNGVSGVPKVTKVWQYTNIIPGIGQLCIREKLCLRLEELSHQSYFKAFTAFPTCIIIHRNNSLETQTRDLPQGYWLVKSEGSVRSVGAGLTIVHTNNIIKKLKEKNVFAPVKKDTKSLYQTRSQTTIEQYVYEPFIVKRRKHLIQLYLLVKSIDPLRVYVSDFGYVTFAQLPYNFEKEIDGGNYSCMHLDFYTSSFCTKIFPISPPSWEVNGKNSLVWTLEHYWAELLNMNVDIQYITAQIHEALLQTAILMASTSSEMIKKNYINERPRFLALTKNGFAIFHVKVLLDKNRKAHVVDIDCDPGLHTLGSDSFRSSQMVMLIQDLIKLSGSFRGKYDRQPYREKLFDNILSFCGNRGGCTEDEIRTIVVFEDERHNSGHFQVIYPHPKTVNTHKTTIKELQFDSVLNEYIEQIRKF